jgi:hypothetical protein
MSQPGAKKKKEVRHNWLFFIQGNEWHRGLVCEHCVTLSHNVAMATVLLNIETNKNF